MIRSIRDGIKGALITYTAILFWFAASGLATYFTG